MFIVVGEFCSCGGNIEETPSQVYTSRFFEELPEPDTKASAAVRSSSERKEEMRL